MMHRLNEVPQPVCTVHLQEEPVFPVGALAGECGPVPSKKRKCRARLRAAYQLGTVLSRHEVSAVRIRKGGVRVGNRLEARECGLQLLWPSGLVRVSRLGHLDGQQHAKGRLPSSAAVE